MVAWPFGATTLIGSTLINRWQLAIVNQFSKDSNSPKLVVAVLGEEGHYGVQNDVGSVQVNGSALDQHIASVQRYFTVLAWPEKK